MNTEILSGKWDQLKGQVKQQWGKLTDDDLLLVKGKKDELVGKIKERYGYSKEQAQKEVDAFLEESER